VIRNKLGGSFKQIVSFGIRSIIHGGAEDACEKSVGQNQISDGGCNKKIYFLMVNDK
jgi:hypothetical protein